MPKRKSGSVRYERNPFREETVHDAEQGKKVKTAIAPIKDSNLSAMLIKSDGKGNALEETPASLALCTPKVVDANEFVKIYTKGVAGMFGLSSPGRKVFTLLFTQLAGASGLGKDIVTLQYSALPEETKKILSYRTFTKGINDLIKNRFIAQSIYNGQYFVNPTFIYNGDRLAIVTLYKKELAGERQGKTEKKRQVHTDRNGVRFEQPYLDLGEPGTSPFANTGED